MSRKINAKVELDARRAGDRRRAQELRDKRRSAGLRQVSFWIKEGDEDAANIAMAPLTDKAWLALYDKGAIERRSDPDRAAEIRARSSR